MMSSLLLKNLGLLDSQVSYVIGEQDYTSDQKFYVYSGKGLNNSVFHMGHFYTLGVINQVVSRLECPLLYQIASDQKRWYTKQIPSRSKLDQLTKEHIRFLNRFFWLDDSVHLFSNLDPFNFLALRTCADFLSSRIPLSKILKIFGQISVHSAYLSAVQLAPMLLNPYATSRRALIITADDQVGYFYLFRDFCSSLNIKKPIVVVLNPVKNMLLKDKMSSSCSKLAITLDTSGISKIKQALSSTEKDLDFASHLVDKLILVLESETLKTRLKDMITDYRQNGRSLEFKISLMNLLTELKDQQPRSDLKLKQLVPLKDELSSYCVQVQELYLDLNT